MHILRRDAMYMSKFTVRCKQGGHVVLIRYTESGLRPARVDPAPAHEQRVDHIILCHKRCVFPVPHEGISPPFDRMHTTCLDSQGGLACLCETQSRANCRVLHRQTISPLSAHLLRTFHCEDLRHVAGFSLSVSISCCSLRRRTAHQILLRKL